MKLKPKKESRWATGQMKFETKEDIAAPLEYVFRVVSDFDGFERQAMRRGAEVSRLDALSEPGMGMAWDIAFPLRGKTRQLQIELTDFDLPHRMMFESRSPNMGGHMVVDLVALSRQRTRLGLELELKLQNLSARLLVQSLKLARNNLNKRFQIRVAEFAKTTEERYEGRMA